MESEKQNSGVPPGRPPPPFYPSAPLPYVDPQGGMQPGGAAPYGVPPPAYCTPPPNQMGYPPPGGYQVPPNQVHQLPPQGYPGGQLMYPNLSELPQPEAVPLGFMTGGGHPAGPDPNQIPHPGAPPMGPSPVPMRPAPCPPGQNPAAPAPYVAPTSDQAQAAWWTNLRDGEAPPGCVISWKGGGGLKIYFIQEEGHIVSPKKPLEMAVYKKINGKGGVVEENLLGMVEVLGCWRLRLHGKSSFCLHTYNDTYVFLDDSTCPRRIVIIELPQDVSNTMRADLLAHVKEMADLREEQEGVVGKITTNVGSVYTDITKKLNTAVKDVVPGAHKSTKWLRKGTGNLVRMGGNLMTKGMHLIADQMPANQTEHEMMEYEESPFHSELMEGLLKFHKAVESGSITYV